MKTRPDVLSLVTAICAVGSALPASAQISEDEFKALKETVLRQGQRLEQLEKDHQKDQQIHEQDLQQIHTFQQQLGDAQLAVTNVVQRLDTAAQVQPVHPVPPGPAATHNFTMVGDAEVQFGKVDGSHSAFGLADFAPIFLYRAGNDVLFEAGFDVRLQNNAPSGSGATTTVDLSFAQLDYLLNDYLTLVGGYMVLPLGTYTERSAGWLNKIPDDPLPRGMLPSNGAGFQLRGALPVGQTGQSLTYSVFGVNGPGSVDGSGTSTNLDLGGNVGFDSNGNRSNLHGAPSGGGRIGWFMPFKPHYDLELGVSGMAGPWDNAGDQLWSALVLDAAVHISPAFEVKGEYINSWYDTTDVGTVHPHGWWVQPAYKLSGLNLDLPYINNVELVGRYDTMKDGLGSKTDRWTLGFVYYFSSTLLFEGDYEFVHGDHDQFVFQLSYGF